LVELAATSAEPFLGREVGEQLGNGAAEHLAGSSPKPLRQIGAYKTHAFFAEAAADQGAIGLDGADAVQLLALALGEKARWQTVMHGGVLLV
jgi:hypothetical protein